MNSPTQETQEVTFDPKVPFVPDVGAIEQRSHPSVTFLYERRTLPFIPEGSQIQRGYTVYSRFGLEHRFATWGQSYPAEDGPSFFQVAIIKYLSSVGPICSTQVIVSAHWDV